MNFGNIITEPCVVQPPQPDNRCADPAFALANPDVCPPSPVLVIKPSIAITCELGSIQFGVFTVLNGVETDVTKNSEFSSSDPGVVVVGAGSGNATATGLTMGDATITARFNALTASADMTVLSGGGQCGCVGQTTVAMEIVIDESRSMSQTFASPYSTRLDFAKAAATRFITELNAKKDTIGLVSFDASQQTILSGQSNDRSALKALVAGITQTQNLTTFYAAINAALSELASATADRKVLVLFSDGEDNTSSYNSTNNPITLASNFKSQGGIVMCIGARASGKGYSLLSSLATGGFFVNGYPGTASQAIDLMSGLKGYVAAGNCTPEGDIIAPQPSLDYTGFQNWDVLVGVANLFGPGLFDLLPGNGQYVALDSEDTVLQSKTAFNFVAGKTYRLSLSIAGNQRGMQGIISDTVNIKVGDGTMLDQTVVLNDFTQDFHNYNFSFTAPATTAEKIVITGTIQVDPSSSVIGFWGALIDSILLTDVTDVTTMLADDFGNENQRYVPPRCGPGHYQQQNYYSWSDIEDVVPLMTSNTQPGGVASCSPDAANPGDPTQQNGAFQAFDGSPFSILKLNTTSPNGPVTPAQWIQYQFTSAQTILSYRLWPWIASTAPKTWIFQGSNDGVNWTTLDSQTGITSWSDQTPKLFNIGSPQSFLFYRITISALNWDGINNTFHVDIQQIELLASVSHSGVQAIPLIPAMTGPSTPSGTASASSEVSGKEAWRCMTPAGFGFTNWASTSLPAWVAYNFGSTKIVTEYLVEMGNNSQIPDAFTFEGSNDGVTWAVLDTQTNQSAAIHAALSAGVTYVLSAPASYKQFRLNVSLVDSASSASFVTIQSFQVFGPTIISIYGYCCDYGSGCLSATPPGAQLADPNPLPDIESGFTPSTTYTSTQQACASCPVGNENTSTTTLVPIMTSDILPSGVASASEEIASFEAFKCFDGDTTTALNFWQTANHQAGWVAYQFTAPVAIAAYQITCAENNLGPQNFTFEGSNDGSTWTVIDTRAGILWFDNETKNFSLLAAATYTHFRVNVTTTSNGSGLRMREIGMFGSAVTQVCKTATATSTISQGDADTKATAAALALAQAELNCQQVFSSTEQFTASCLYGLFPVTKSANATSFNSQAEADAAALAAATAAAQAALNCNQSNNTGNIAINDAAPPVLGKSSPYPAVKFISGGPASITKVTVSINGFAHTHPSDVVMILVAPDGTGVVIMAQCGGSVVVTGINLVFDDAAGGSLGTGALVSGTYKPSIVNAVWLTNPIPVPAPQASVGSPLTSALSTFIGKNANGLWALFVSDVAAINTGNIANGFDLTIT